MKAAVPLQTYIDSARVRSNLEKCAMFVVIPSKQTEPIVTRSPKVHDEVLYKAPWIKSRKGVPHVGTGTLSFYRSQKGRDAGAH